MQIASLGAAGDLPPGGGAPDDPLHLGAHGLALLAVASHGPAAGGRRCGDRGDEEGKRQRDERRSGATRSPRISTLAAGRPRCPRIGQRPSSRRPAASGRRRGRRCASTRRARGRGTPRRRGTGGARRDRCGTGRRSRSRSARRSGRRARTRARSARARCGASTPSPGSRSAGRRGRRCEGPSLRRSFAAPSARPASRGGPTCSAAHRRVSGSSRYVRRSCPRRATPVASRRFRCLRTRGSERSRDSASAGRGRVAAARAARDRQAFGIGERAEDLVGRLGHVGGYTYHPPRGDDPRALARPAPDDGRADRRGPPGGRPLGRRAATA